MIDLGELIPILGITLLAVTTLGSIVGAYAMGRLRRRERAEVPRADAEDRHRLERIEQMMETMSEEMERLGEAQRFLVKVMSDKQIPRPAEPPKAPHRVITPH